MSITVNASVASGAVSITIPALPRKRWIFQPSGMNDSAIGASTPSVMAASSPMGLGAERIDFIRSNWSSGMRSCQGLGAASFMAHDPTAREGEFRMRVDPRAIAGIRGCVPFSNTERRQR